ncbi:MAG: hypothetical protein GIX03_02340 [Candidatus Eremiobacteraeota bacterium]|nr:hypothetical protein [Candidatus Eremiobacteraeota bacterium]MBC5801856.1 hypothetical protein [Candidatus Eremiobacteraeota bacterium]MBC5820998.1 hypothetical protein [Candidatus Eremiobacteraeota bacterium]
MLLPAGISLGTTSWPAPDRLNTAGVTTYVYNSRTTLLVPLTVRPDAPAPDAPIAADLLVRTRSWRC